MSRVRQIKSQLEAVAQAIEALDADLAAGRLDSDEHHRRRAEHEREVGRLFVSLRRAQRDAERRQPGPPAATMERRAGWLQSSPVIVAIGSLLLVLGVGAGMLASRWPDGRQAVGTPVVAPGPAAGSSPSTLMSDIELGALRQAAARADTPIAGLLQLAHAELDQGRLDEARAIYGRVLAREARNVEAITHLGAVLYQEGRIDEALAKVEEALRIDPTYVHAHWDRTQYLFHGKRDFAATVAAAEAFLRVVPEGPDANSVRSLMAQAREMAKNSPLSPKPR